MPKIGLADTRYLEAAQGWLGAASPEQFMAATLADYPMPCHQTVVYEDPKWKEKWEKAVRSDSPSEARYCAGAIVFFHNMYKLSRDSKRPRLEEDRENVFSAPQEFINYHKNAAARSWEMKGAFNEEEDDEKPSEDEDDRTL